MNLGEDMCGDGVRIRILTMPRVDTFTVSGVTTPEECGFVPAVTASGEEAIYRPGWWGVAKRIKKGALAGRTLLNARAERAAFEWPQVWGIGRVHPTRVDVCCDFEGFAFTDEHRALFTFRKGKSSTWYAGDVAETLYIGSNASHSNLRLRIYNKTTECNDRDREQWTMNGWSGADVWRVEAQVRERGLPRNLSLPEHVGALWNDALARYRMCARNPRTYSQQNKAPTHDLWRLLGNPERLTRMRRAEVPWTGRDDEHVRRLERLMTAAGARLLPHLLARVERAMLASGGRPLAETRK